MKKPFKACNIKSIVRKITARNLSGNFIAGITTAYEVSDNQLREIILTYSIVDLLKNKKNIFFIINDSLDPFTEMHYRRLIKFDASLDYLHNYIGWPISKIILKNGKNLSNFFSNLLKEKLRKIGIKTAINSVHKFYKSKLYKDYRKILLKNEVQIIKDLKEKYERHHNTIYRPICKKCGRIDLSTYNHKLMEVYCKSCDKNYTVKTIPPGKFIWSVDCAIRWNIFNVTFEAFTQNYLEEEKGSYFISSMISKKYLGKIIPYTSQFAYFKYDISIKNITQLLPLPVIQEIYCNRLTKSSFPSNEKILKIAKSVPFGKKSLYEASLMIHYFEPTYVWDNSTINHLKNIFFVKDISINRLKELFNSCIMFSKKYLGNFPQMIPIERIDFNVVSDKALKNFRSCIFKKKFSSKLIADIYPAFFGSSQGPRYSYILEFLTEDYKKLILEIIDDHLQQKNT